jgi:hypothetical protein
VPPPGRRISASPSTGKLKDTFLSNPPALRAGGFFFALKEVNARTIVVLMQQSPGNRGHNRHFD